ncbi:MAG TPA: adenylate/guanylate cyclase domain-containing protein [Gemmatimonadaceae bacterium]|jgi:adenylate cyclase|nr:adenylate/guanylate cyclase domain-containing protein [Gemmatimonadaceae bacterium]
MPFKLVSADGLHSFDLRDGTCQVVGRAPTSDIPVIDPTISRRHAEVDCRNGGVLVRDLGSSNGTFLNGTRIETASVNAGDTVTFGKVAFKLHQPVPAASQAGPSSSPNATILRQLPVRDSSATIARMGIHGTAIPISAPSAASAEDAADIDKSRQKLATLLEVSKGLGKTADINALLDKIVSYAYQILDVDRVAILLTDETGELTPKIARDKRGGDTTRAVPQSIARTAVKDKVAILSDNAGEDTRFGGQSILMQQIRSAICVPLVGSEDRSLGVLYVDNVTASHRFSDEDFEFCIAFAGIAAVAIDNGQFAQRIQRELLTRSNFERFFTPQLAKRIAESSETMKLGGDKRPIAVLFTDIRGFTAMSESMRPDDMATLLTEYLTEMVECVFAYDGTLDKFIGDSVMAQWGAPLGGPDDADKAMAAAIAMMQELAKLNERWRAEGRPALEHGIGLNFGEAFAGNIGSERRLEFTVIGDVVNTAARLCAAADGEILLTEDFRQRLTDPPKLEECPPMEFKNKSQPVTVYRVVAH